MRWFAVKPWDFILTDGFDIFFDIDDIIFYTTTQRTVGSEPWYIMINSYR